MNCSGNIANFTAICHSQGGQSPTTDWPHVTTFSIERPCAHPEPCKGHADDRCRGGSRVPQAPLA